MILYKLKLFLSSALCSVIVKQPASLYYDSLQTEVIPLIELFYFVFCRSTK